MFHRFDRAAGAVLPLADAQARRFGHKRVGTEHLLLALTKLETDKAPARLQDLGLPGANIAQVVLHKLGVPPASVTSRVEALFQPTEEATQEGKPYAEPLPLTPNAEVALGFAVHAALNAAELDTGHWLAGVLRAPGVARQLLGELGISLRAVESALEGMRAAPIPPERAEELRKEQVTFWRKLGHMIGSGVPIVETFKVIAEEMADTPMSGPAKEVATALGQHGTIYEVLERYRAVFSRSVIDLVRSGEAGGDLDKKALLIAEGIEQGVFPTGGSASEDESPRAAAAPAGEAEAEAHQGRQLANNLVLEAIRDRASDIHLEAVAGQGEGGVQRRVRFRIDGVLSVRRTLGKEDYEALTKRLKLMAGLDLSDEARHLPQDGRIMLSVQRREVDLRVQTAPGVFGEMVTVRLLDRTTVALSLDRLGFTEQHLAVVKDILKRPSGLFIVAGPTGSGKTTILYAMIGSLDSQKLKVCSVEDPVEYYLAGVNQVQVDPRRGLTFPRLVRTFLRSDPNVIMMGELRDQESAWIAHAAVLTGHLVFTTLHTGDAPTTLRRLVDMGVQQWLAADAVIGVLSSRLVRILCTKCRRRSESRVRELQHLDIPDELKSTRYYEAVGCNDCRGTGYRGRMGVYELLLMTDEFRQAFIGEADLSRLRDLAIRCGMVPMLVDALQKAREGQTSVAEVMRVVLLGV